jgi:hypothetical protein
MALLSRLSARRPPRGLGSLPGLLDGDEPQSERLAALALAIGGDKERERRRSGRPRAPGADERSARPYVLAHLLIILLLEPLVDGLEDSPRWAERALAA